MVDYAIKLARLDLFISSLDKGCETEVGERGLKLSGGEKQRISIARNILKNPPILILDEATSALDTHTEKQIEDSLNNIFRNRTTIIIAHRLSTIIQADQIIVLNEGKIIQKGNHNDLLKINGYYANMWWKQLEVDSKKKKLLL